MIVLDCVTQCSQSAAHLYESNRLGLSHWYPYTMRRGGCLELYYCNMVELFWWDLSLISTTNWFNRVQNDLYRVEWDVKQPINFYTIAKNISLLLDRLQSHVSL